MRLSVSDTTDCRPEDVLRFLAKTFSFAWIKFAAAGLLAYLVTYYNRAPSTFRDLLSILLILVCLDFVSGVWLSVGVAKKHLRSSGVFRTICKLGIYGMILIVGGVVDRLFMLPYTFSLIALSMCVLVEGTSVGENLRGLWEHYFSVPWPFGFIFSKLAEYQAAQGEDDGAGDDDG